MQRMAPLIALGILAACRGIPPVPEAQKQIVERLGSHDWTERE